MAETGYLISEAMLADLRRMKRKLDGIRGDHVTNAPDSITIGSPEPVRAGEEGRRRVGTILAKVTGEGADDGLYQAVEVIWDESESAYITKSGGRTWDGGESPNLPELRELNGATGISEDTIVQVLRTVGDEGTVEWVFAAATGLPEGTGQYKVLQLDADDEPHWDYPRLH